MLTQINTICVTVFPSIEGFDVRKKKIWGIQHSDIQTATKRQNRDI